MEGTTDRGLWDELDELEQTWVQAFTWTPNPARYPNGRCRHQYKVLLDWVLLCAYKYFRAYTFIPEINTNGNVHIHGWYIVQDKISYFKQFLPRCKALGFVLVKPKADGKWIDYCHKELDDTIAVIGEGLPIPLTHLNTKAYIALRKEKSKNKKLLLNKPLARPGNLTKYFK